MKSESKRALWLGAVAWCALNAHGQHAAVRWDETRQPIDGFGACDAWYTEEIMRHPDRDEMLDILFSREGGAGLSILRHRVPAQEKQMTDYVMELTSGDLDMGDKPSHGVRFTDIDIPAGADVSAAYVQFSAKGDQSIPSVLTVTGQAHDDAATFSAQAGDLSDRARTTASVSWEIPAWGPNERGQAQRTPDIGAIIGEIIGRDTWRAGNALALFIEGTSGKRSALTWDADPAASPELVVEYGEAQSLSRKVAASGDDAEELAKSDFSYACELTQEAFARGCELTWAAAWSPPYEWKTSNAEQNGELRSQHYQEYADYLEAYRRRFTQQSGIALYGVSPQNEPGNKPWESCIWDNTDFRDFVKNNLGPTLDPSCKIIVPEETNWNDVDNFYAPIHDDAEARDYVDIVAGHVYGGDPDHSYNHFGKPVWETEWSYDTSNEDLGIGNGVRWAYNFWRLLVNAGVRACHHWWLVNMKSHEGDQQGLMNAIPGEPGFETPKRLWAIGNFSKFVRPGWVRIDATKTPGDDLYCAAFQSVESDSFALVVINRGSGEQSLSISFEGFACSAVSPHRTSEHENLAALAPIDAGEGFEASLPGTSVTTFVGVNDGGLTKAAPGMPMHPATLRHSFIYAPAGAAVMRFSLERTRRVFLDIYDSRGAMVRSVNLGLRRRGAHAVHVARPGGTGGALPAGVYACRIRVR